jgi:protein involved in polysaccharide export with SLBB domain
MLLLCFIAIAPSAIHAQTTGTTGTTGGEAAAPSAPSDSGSIFGGETDSGADISPGDIFSPEIDSGSGQIEVLDFTDDTEQQNAPVGPADQGNADWERDYISGASPSQITKNLPRFGYSFFRNPPTTFAPVNNVPVGPDYVVAPGDTIRIDFWGLDEGHYTVPVDRNGSLALPRAGVIGVAGLTFERVQQAIENAYAMYYTNFEINVTMGNLRSITVYVVGHANSPGAYSLSSMSTIMNALLASGGPDLSGSLRNIQLKRNDRVVSTFDAYDLLMHGSKARDLRLMDGDVIFIPPVGPIVGITGDIKKPAYYELKERIRIADLVEMAGGFTNRYFKGRIQVDRTMGNQYRTSFESDLQGFKTDYKKNIPLENGDLVKIYSVTIQESQVYLSGAVPSPGKFAITEGKTRVSDVIKRAGGLLYMASEQGELTRVNVTQSGPQTQRYRFNIKDALRGDRGDNLLLQVNDYITVRTVPEWNLYRTVRIQGEVKYPGVYTIQKGERLSNLLEMAGGYTDNAFLDGATFTRTSVKQKQQQRINQMIDRLEKQLYGASVSATGTALTESDARMTQMETEQRQIFLNRLKETQSTGRIVVKIPENPRLLKGTPYDLELEQGDTLNIPGKPQTIQVVGAVYNPMAFVFRPDQPFTYYVDQAGGYGFNADRKRVYIIKADGTASRAWVNKNPVTIEDGDSIVVPDKINVKANLRDTRDIVDIVYKVAVGAAVLLD